MSEAQGLWTPARLFTSIVFTGVSIVAGLVLTVIVSAELVMPLDDQARNGIYRIVGALTLSGGLVATLVAWRVLRESYLLYGSLRAGLSEQPEAGYPSEDALRAAYRAPTRILVWMAASGATTFLVDVLLGGELTGLSGGALWLNWFYVLSWLPLGFYPMMVLWRRAFWEWLSAVPPTEFSLATDGRLVRRTMNRVFWPLLSVGLVLASVMISTNVGETPPSAVASILTAMVVLGVPALAALAAWRGGRFLATDLRRVSSWIEAVVGEEAAGQRPTCTTIVAGEIASSVDRLRARYDALAQAEAEQREAVLGARAMRSRFFTYMSHDLRSPLNSIRGFAQILARQTDGILNESQLESVDLIRQSGDELLRLVTNLLDTAKVEAGEMSLHRTWSPPVETVSQAIGAVRAHAEERDIRLETRVAAGLPLIYVDAPRVLQAVTLVLDHIVRQTRGNEVRIQAFTKSSTDDGMRSLVIAVIDTQGGMREEDRDKVTQALVDIDNGEVPMTGATGLGLSLANALIQAHDGRIRWHSIPSAEARLEVWLPVAKPDGSPRQSREITGAGY